jgi:hypothetical protein
MSESQDNNTNDKHHNVGDIEMSKIDDKAGIHSSSQSARHLEHAQDRKMEVAEGINTDSWQTKEKVEI